MLPREYYLVANPFKPQSGDRRPLDKTPLVGRARFILRSILDAAESKHVTLYVVYGDWGHGKTTVFRKAMAELSSRHQDKVFAARYRVPRGKVIPFRRVVSAALKFYADCLNHGKLACESTEEEEQYDPEKVDEIQLSEFITGVEKIVEECRKRGIHYVLLGLDQLESVSVEPKDLDDMIFRMRDLYDTYTGKTGIVLALLATPQWLPRSMIDRTEYRRLMGGALQVEEIESLGLEETKQLIRELLLLYRSPNAPANLSPFHPFTEEAVEEIHRLSQGIPRRIYEIASRVLEEGLAPLIDADQVILYSGIFKQAWYNALNLPPVSLRQLLQVALHVASQLAHEGKLRVKVLSIPTENIDENRAPALLEPREGTVNAREMVRDVRRAADILVYTVTEDGAVRAYLIKTTDKVIHKGHLEALVEFAKKYTLKFRGKPVAPDLVTLLLVSRRIAKTVRGQVDLIEATTAIPISIRWVEVTREGEDDPRKYGVLRWIYEEYHRCGDDPDCLSRLVSDVQQVIATLLGVKVEEE